MSVYVVIGDVCMANTLPVIGSGSTMSQSLNLYLCNQPREGKYLSVSAVNRKYQSRLLSSDFLR